MKPRVEAWAHRVGVLSKISQQHAQLIYSGLGMLLQLNTKYLQRTVPGVVILMGPIEEYLIETSCPALFGGRS